MRAGTSRCAVNWPWVVEKPPRNMACRSGKSKVRKILDTTLSSFFVCFFPCQDALVERMRLDPDTA